MAPGVDEVVVTATSLALGEPPIERHPRAQVLVSQGVSTESPLPPWWLDISGHVLSARTVKTLGSPVGEFEVTCTMAPLGDAPGADLVGNPALLGKALSAVLIPNNVLWIAFDSGLPPPWGHGFETVMIGWITAVEASTSIDQRGRPVRTVTITGGDSGKFYVGHDLPSPVLTAYMQGETELERRAALGLTVMGTVGKVLEGVYLNVFQALQPVPLAVREEGQLLIDPLLDGGEGPEVFTAYFYPHDLWQRQGKFWNIFVDHADRDWTEVYGDYIANPATHPVYANYRLVRPGVEAGMTLSGGGGPGYYLIARRRPFPWGVPGSAERVASQARWDALPMTAIPDTVLKQEQVRLDDSERVNLVMVKIAGSDVLPDQIWEATAYGSALYDRDSMQQHGTHTYVGTTPYAPDPDGATLQDPSAQQEYANQQGTAWETIKRRARALFDWYWPNHRFWSGTWIVAGTPSIHIGERVCNAGDVARATVLVTEAPPRSWYVERVVQDYVDGSHYFTHLALTRGESLIASEAAQLLPGASLPMTIPPAT
jgi:hypothetical protein